jgi:hypothetical protein
MGRTPKCPNGGELLLYCFCIGSIAAYTFTSPFSFSSAAENGPFFFWFR